MTARHHGRKGRPWRRLRDQVLTAQPYCQIRGPKCTRIATQADHIIPLHQRPDLAHDPDNIRSACTTCNAAAGARYGNRLRRKRPRPRRERGITRLTW